MKNLDIEKIKILHIPQRYMGLKKSFGGVKSILFEQVKYENQIKNIESKILVYDKIEEKNAFFINKNSIREDILDYEPNFVIFDGFWMIQHCFIAKFLKKQNIKYYIKPHGGFNIVAYKSSKIKFLKKYIARKLLFDNYVKNSSGFIFLNKLEKEKSIYGKKDEFILPNGIEKENLSLCQKNNKVINFIFLGRIDIINKGLDSLFNTILNNKEYFIENNIIFNFYGTGRKKDMELFNSYLLKIPQVIKYNGVIYGEEKYRVLEKNDILILLSRNEGMPMVILEALSMGIPCFITEETAMGEYIKRYNAGWIVNKETLIEDLKLCVEDYRKNKQFYQKTSLKCSQEFYWKNIMKKYMLEYKRMNSKCQRY